MIMKEGDQIELPHGGFLLQGSLQRGGNFVKKEE
jgi:hypothetical protein